MQQDRDGSASWNVSFGIRVEFSGIFKFRTKIVR